MRVNGELHFYIQMLVITIYLLEKKICFRIISDKICPMSDTCAKLVSDQYELSNLSHHH